MELLPNDVRTLVYRILHRYHLCAVHIQMFEWLEWIDGVNCLVDKRAPLDISDKAFVWRVLTDDMYGAYIFRRDHNGHMMWTKHPLPVTYCYSIGHRVTI